jgi:hypothetical protein
VYTVLAEHMVTSEKTSTELFAYLESNYSELLNDVMPNPTRNGLGRLLKGKIDRTHGNYKLRYRSCSNISKYRFELITKEKVRDAA